VYVEGVFIPDLRQEVEYPGEDGLMYPGVVTDHSEDLAQCYVEYVIGQDSEGEDVYEGFFVDTDQLEVPSEDED
jgi:hypothetical protein